MKAFRFQKFDIQQSKEVFRVGTDGVLLGALASVVNANSALEIGVGSGLISLMLAQRNSKIQIDGIDVNPKAVEFYRISRFFLACILQGIEGSMHVRR